MSDGHDHAPRFRDAYADKVERDPDGDAAPDEPVRTPGKRVRVGREWIWWSDRAGTPGKLTRVVQDAARLRDASGAPSSSRDDRARQQDAIARAMREPSVPLPYRATLEELLGIRLDIEAHVGLRVRAELYDLGAAAAQHGAHVAFVDDRPDLETVAHEVAHVLQTGAVHDALGGDRTIDSGAQDIADDGSRAELEADAFASSVRRGALGPRPMGMPLFAHVGLSRSPASAHLLRVRQVRRGSDMIWREVGEGETAESGDLDTETMSDAELVALLGDLLAERMLALASNVLRAVSSQKLHRILKHPHKDTPVSVLSYLRVQLDPQTTRMSWWDFAILLTNERDDSVREMLIVSQCGTNEGFLITLWKNLKTQARSIDREEDHEAWCDNVAIREFIKQISQATPIPQHGIAWFRSTMLDGAWVSTSSVDERQQKQRPIGTLSIHGLLAAVRDHFRAVSRAARSKRPLERPPLVSDTGADIRGLLASVEQRIVDLVKTGDISQGALCVSMLHEMALTGQEGSEWSEGVLIRLVPILVDRAIDRGDPSFRGDLADVLRIVHAYGELARRDPEARRLVETFAPRINEGLSKDDVGKKDFRFDRYLSGSLLAMSNVRSSEVDVYRAFSLVEPHVLELLGQEQELDDEGKPRIVPESIANLLQAFARMLGGTEFDNLPDKIQSLLQRVVGYAEKFVPKSNTKRRNAKQFSTTDLVALASALMQFRNPPEGMVAFLGSIAGPTAEAIQHERVRLSDLETLLRGFHNLFGDVVALLPLYESVLAKLHSLVEASETPSPSLVRLVVLAYNQRDILARQARWYEREVKRREELAKGRKESTDPWVSHGRGAHDTLSKRASDVAGEVEDLFDALLAKTRARIDEYQPNQQRRILFELTQVRGLSISRTSEDEEEDESSETKSGKTAGEIFHHLGATRSMLGEDLGALDCHTIACLVYDYGWLRARDPNDQKLLGDLIGELDKRAPAMTPHDLTAVLGVLAKLRRPTQEVAAYLEGLTLVAARMIRRHLDELSPTFFAKTLSAYRELPTPIVVRFLELVESVVLRELDRSRQVALADLLYITETFVRFDDEDRDEGFKRGDPEHDELKFEIIDTLRKRLDVSLGKQTDEDEIYDRAKARITRRTLPWRGYDDKLNKVYPLGEKQKKRALRARTRSEKAFLGSDGVEALERNEETLYEVHTITPEGELVASEVQDNVIFRELTAHELDFVYVQLPERAHIDKFKGVVTFRNKTYRYDVYGGSSLKGDPDKGKQDGEKHIKALGVELEAVEFFRKLFNYQEGFYYAQRALFPNDARESLGLKGRMRGMVVADGKEFTLIEGMPFRPYDGWGFIKKSLIGKSLDKHRNGDRRLEVGPKPGNMSYQALQWYSHDQETIDEAVGLGENVLRGQEEHEDELQQWNMIYRALTTGRPTVRTTVAMPVMGRDVVLPSGTPQYESTKTGVLIGRAPYDNPNLHPIGEGTDYGVNYNSEPPPDEMRPLAGKKKREKDKLEQPKQEPKQGRRKKRNKKTQQAPRSSRPEQEPKRDLDPSQFMSTIESIQYTMTGYVTMSEEEQPRLAFLKGMMGIIDDEIWPLSGVDFVVSNQDIKLDESWEGREEKVRLEEHTRFDFQGMLVVKDWNAPERHVGVPVDVQKWLAGDFDGDPAAILSRDEVPKLYDHVLDEFRPQGVSGKLTKTFTNSNDVLTRARQIADIRSKVLGTWSTISDRVLSESPENREILAKALVEGNITQSDEELADLICAFPNKEPELIAQLETRDKLLLSMPGAWDEGASFAERAELKRVLESVTQAEEQERAPLQEKLLAELVRSLSQARAWHELKCDPEDKEGMKARKKAIAKWLAGTGKGTRDVIRNLYAVELLDMEIQTGIKVGTDGYKTKAATRKYEARAREVLKTANKLKIANKPVPYGKSLLKKIDKLGVPNLENDEWKTIYFRCRELYGIPARILQEMIESIAQIVPVDYDAEYEEWRSKRNQPTEESGKPEDKSDERLEQLEQIFVDIYVKMANDEGAERSEPNDGKDGEKDTKDGKKETKDGKKEHKSKKKGAEEDEENLDPGLPVSGLPNRGNTCYVAGAIHVIAANPTYRAAFEAPDGELDEHETDLCTQVTALLQKIDAGQKIEGVDVDLLLVALDETKCLEQNVNAQQDSGELLARMLEVVGCRQSVSITRDRAMPQSELGPQTQRNHMLTLEGLSESNKSFRSMSDLLENTAVEPQYEEGQLGELHLQWFDELPDTLTIQIKRTGFNVKTHRAVKLLERLAGPMTLIVPAKMAPDEREHTYQLTCFVLHSNEWNPRSPRGGHFISFARKNGDWYKCDDSSVTRVTTQHAEAVAMCAYLFVYQKGDDDAPVEDVLDQLGHDMNNELVDEDDGTQDGRDEQKHENEVGAKEEPKPSEDEPKQKRDGPGLAQVVIGEIRRKGGVTGLKSCRKRVCEVLSSSASDGDKRSLLAALITKALEVKWELDALAQWLAGLGAPQDLLDGALHDVTGRANTKSGVEHIRDCLGESDVEHIVDRDEDDNGTKSEPKSQRKPKSTAKRPKPESKSKPTLDESMLKQLHERLLSEAQTTRSGRQLEQLLARIDDLELPSQVVAKVLGAAILRLMKASLREPLHGARAVLDALRSSKIAKDVIRLALDEACKLIGEYPKPQQKGNYFAAFISIYEAYELDTAALIEVARKAGLTVSETT